MSGRELFAVAYDDVMGAVTRASPTGALLASQRASTYSPDASAGPRATSSPRR